MKDVILIELCKSWEKAAKAPDIENGAEESKIQNATDHGIRQGMRACADSLRMLVDILGDKGNL